MRVLVFIAILHICAGLAVQPSSVSRSSPARIVGGSETSIQQYPFVTNMQYLWGGFWWTQWCGGTLLTSRTIMSAAHCFYDDQTLDSWRVRVGSSFASSGGALHAVAQFLLHEQYDNVNLDYDVAIVRLATAVVLGPMVAAGRIVAPGSSLLYGTPLTAIGWGALSSSGGYPEQLQHVEIPIVNQQLCTERYSTFQGASPITDRMFCTGGNEGACLGDDGGPLVVKTFDGDIVYGITSWSHVCGSEIYPGVSTRVSYFTDWIVANGST